MNTIIKKVLAKLENNGFEAYIIGGYVRDLLVGKESFDIDICTNAIPKDLINLFPKASSKNLGGIDFKIKEFHFEITTYREEIKYKDRKPIKYNYINNLVEDLKRRDFTINTICMNSKGEIIDLLNGTKDIMSYKVKMIGDIDTKIIEDPLRMLRAIRIATILNFNIEPNLYKTIKKYNKKILELSNTRIREELDKILLSNNVLKGFNLLKDLGILKLLEINYNNIVPVKNIEAMYAQIETKYKFAYTKVEKENINKLKQIIAKKEINKMTLYNYGLYLSIVAGEILSIDSKYISKLDKELPIHDKKDININPKDIIKILNINENKISKVLTKLESEILDNNLKNRKWDIIKYLKENKDRW